MESEIKEKYKNFCHLYERLETSLISVESAFFKDHSHLKESITNGIRQWTNTKKIFQELNDLIEQLCEIKRRE